MQTSPVNLDLQQFFQADIAQSDAAAKMVQQRELARLIRRLEDAHMQPEGFCEPIRIGRIEIALLVEQSDTASAFARFPSWTV